MKFNTVQKDLENEVWKDIKNYQGKYWISDKGRYKSLQKGKKYYYSLGAIHSKGYLYVNLYKNGIRDPRLIHDLVVETFIRPLKQGEITHHINENKQDNRLQNLRIEPLVKHSHSHHKGKKIGPSKLKGIPRTEEVKRKISQSKKGHIVTQQTRKKLSKANKGKKRGPMSEERKRHISEAKRKKSK